MNAISSVGMCRGELFNTETEYCEHQNKFTQSSTANLQDTSGNYQSIR